MEVLENSELENLLAEKGYSQDEIDYLVGEFLEKEALTYVVAMCATDKEFKDKLVELINK